tara:strand:- start:79 stop:3561 length:3483 start_codon:yes stop_codon:yes gene_type:complete
MNHDDSSIPSTFIKNPIFDLYTTKYLSISDNRTVLSRNTSLWSSTARHPPSNHYLAFGTNDPLKSSTVSINSIDSGIPSLQEGGFVRFRIDESGTIDGDADLEFYVGICNQPAKNWLNNDMSAGVDGVGVATYTGAVFRYLQIKALGTKSCTLMEVQAWVGNVNIAAVANGAAEAVWINYQDPDATQQSMSHQYNSDYYYASLANNNILGAAEPVDVYKFAHSDNDNFNINMLIDLQNTYNVSDLQAIVVYNRNDDAGGSSAHRIEGFKPQLLDSNMNIIYDGSSFTGGNAYHRVNGPAWSSVSSSLLTDDQNDFATKIINLKATDWNNTTVYGGQLFGYPNTGNFWINNPFGTSNGGIGQRTQTSGVVKYSNIHQWALDYDGNVILTDRSLDFVDQSSSGDPCTRFIKITQTGILVLLEDSGGTVSTGKYYNSAGDASDITYSSREDLINAFYNDTLFTGATYGFEKDDLFYETTMNLEYIFTNPNFEIFALNDGNSSFHGRIIQSQNIVFDILSTSSVQKNGVNTDLYSVSTWKYFTILSIEPTDTSEYIIEWEDDPVSAQHGGYFLNHGPDQNGGTGISDTNLRAQVLWHWNTDPQTPDKGWFVVNSNEYVFYSGGRSTADQSTVAVYDKFRTKHTMKFKIYDNTNWQMTYVIDGSDVSFIIPTINNFTINDKDSIQLRYYFDSSTHTSPHKITVNNSQEKLRQTTDDATYPLFNSDIKLSWSDENDIIQYEYHRTDSTEFPPFTWPYDGATTLGNEDTYGTNTYGGYELTTSGEEPLKQYLLYQGNGSSDPDIFMTLGAYNATDGTYPGSARLSANSDSDGNDIPLGEWHKIHMPNPIILNTVNIAARYHEWGRPRKWSIYGSNDDSIWTLLLFKANDPPGATGGTTYTMAHQTLPFEYFAIVVEENENYAALNIAAISWFGQEVKTITKHIQSNISNEKYLFGFLKNRFSNAEIKVYGNTNTSYLAASVLNKPPIEFILTPNESFSIDFFVRLNEMDTLMSNGDTSDPKNYYIITKTQATSGTNINQLYYDINYVYHDRFVFDQELESQFQMTTGVSTTIGEWTHIAMTFDATNNQLKAFFNGTEFTTHPDFSSVNTSQWATFQLPGFQRGPDGPGADIDYVYNFYPNKILTQIEVNDLQGKTQDNISTIFNYYN